MSSINLPFRTTPATLPSAKIFFKCKELFAGDGYGVMADSIGGAVYNPIRGNTGQYPDSPANTPFQSGVVWMENGVGTRSNTVFPSIVDSTPLESGSWPNFGSKHIVMFACGILKNSYCRVPIGNGSTFVPGQDGNFSISFNGRFHSVIRSKDDGLLAALADPEGMTMATLIDDPICLIGEYSPATTDGVTVTNGSARWRCTDMVGDVYTSGFTAPLGAGAPLDMTLVVDTVGEVSPHIRNVTRISGCAFYSIVVFAFDTMPPQAVRDAAFAWMRAHHPAGHRELPPMFAGYS
jgi:hypothetical protein